MGALEEFLRKHPVFTLGELKEALGGGRSVKTLYNLLQHHKRAGHIVQVDGVYCVVPPSLQGESFVPDRFLVASKLRPDAVLSHHTALEFWGLANQIFATTYYTSARYRRPLTYQGIRYVCLLLPKSLKGKPFLSTVLSEKEGVPLRVATKERALVECLDRPDLCGGFEEVVRCLSSLPYVDEGELWAYLEARGKVVLFAKVGWVLETFKEQLFISDELLSKLRRRIPSSPVAIDRSFRGRKRFVRSWNIVVPISWKTSLEGGR